jgi:hypothetical protein
MKLVVGRLRALSKYFGHGVPNFWARRAQNRFWARSRPPTHETNRKKVESFLILLHTPNINKQKDFTKFHTL